MNNNIPASVLKDIKKAQKNEITEYLVYSKLSKKIKNSENRKIVENIASDEQRHYQFWKEYTHVEIKPSRLTVFFHFIVAIFLGLTFGIKLLERKEEQAQINYSQIIDHIPEAKSILHDEEEHEDSLIRLINEEQLFYIGSIVLGLNDALVELTGALAGLSFALQNTQLIALAGLITGISASLSMAASEYLSTKSEGDNSRALPAAVYTGIAYISTVILLILPFLLLPHYVMSLIITLIIALLIILFFNFYIAIVKEVSFKKRFLEMAGLSMGVAALSFGIGVLIRLTLGVDI